jgi:hypothetical protein
VVQQWRLMRGSDDLGTLTAVSVDQPWFECRFTPTDAFVAVRPLFDDELRLLEAGEMESWTAAWERIAALILSLEPMERGDLVENFLLHVYHDGRARLRYN